MKRSNRLVMLIGLLLAVVAFVGIFLLLTNNSGTGTGGGGGGTPKTLPTVYAAKDIPLGVTVTTDMVYQKDTPTEQRAADAFNSTTLVTGQIARRPIPQDHQITAADFSASGSAVVITVPPTRRAISVQVDQVTGVGTLIKPGDYVDMIVGFTADKFPVVTVQRATAPNTPNTITPISGINATSVKLLLQGMQVLGTLLPPPPATTNGQPAPSQAATSLTGQQEIVVLSVTAQQAEVVKFAQMDGNVSLVLRSSKDFQDKNDPTIAVTPVPDVTTGIILKTLVDEYGVLVPQIVETVVPSPSP